MGGMRGRDFLPPMGRRDPMPLPPPLGSGSMRGLSSSSGPSMRSAASVSSSYDAVFSRRTPPRSSNGMSRFAWVFWILKDLFVLNFFLIHNFKFAVPTKTLVVIRLMTAGRFPAHATATKIVDRACEDHRPPIDMPRIEGRLWSSEAITMATTIMRLIGGGTTKPKISASRFSFVFGSISDRKINTFFFADGTITITLFTQTPSLVLIFFFDYFNSNVVFPFINFDFRSDFTLKSMKLSSAPPQKYSFDFLCSFIWFKW